MNFEDMKKIWDAQNNRALFAIDEEALHRRITAEKRKGYRIVGVSELLNVGVNVATASFILVLSWLRGHEHAMMYVLSGWMLLTAAGVLISRIRRTRALRRFDRSMRGDLEHAIALAVYQVGLSRTIRWTAVLVALLTIVQLWNSGSSGWLVAGVIAFFTLVIYAAGWEHSIYESRRRRLEELKTELEDNG